MILSNNLPSYCKKNDQKQQFANFAKKNDWNSNCVWSWVHLLIVLTLFDDHHIITSFVFCPSFAQF